jgi:hypothetical protein
MRIQGKKLFNKRVRDKVFRIKKEEEEEERKPGKEHEKAVIKRHTNRQ